MRNTASLSQIVERHRNGEAVGIPSICSAHPEVLRTAIHQAAEKDSLVLIEATCNQVNQEGGYTGMHPADFYQLILELAESEHLPPERLLFGGDHLGPSPWQNLPVNEAMAKARILVGDFVRAGAVKIHLDASMKLVGDDLGHPLPPEVAAERAACLAQSAEGAAGEEGAPLYIIGTEVPVPGGAQEHETGVAVTRPEDAEQTLDLTRRAFRKKGLEAAWDRVIGLVVQPGVEFGNDFVLDYNAEAAQSLSRTVEAHPKLVYEAHSTDYQTPRALAEMVRDHFAILKVGPALTFALREALFALAQIEDELLAPAERSHLISEMDAVMQVNPKYWQAYYPGSAKEQAFARKYSFSDRMRYYWVEPRAQAAVGSLIQNLKRNPPPAMLLSQYLPLSYRLVREGKLKNDPVALIQQSIAQVISDYRAACSLG